MFPNDFVWGAAASSYQIEGASDADGKGPSIWDRFCQRRGAIRRQENGNVAADHYHRFAEDAVLMQQMGLPAYRGSISWPRVIPHGVGRVNKKGLDFYDALVDTLLAADVEPWMTLFHWDYPAALEERGGWRHADSPRWFADYARVVVERLGDRVGHWITINEPQVFLQFGLGNGEHAPGLKLPLAERLSAAHNVLLAHGLAVQTLRVHARCGAQIGWAPVGVTKVPLGANDVEAARQASMAIDATTVWNNTWFNDPIFFGRYPQEGLDAYGAACVEPAQGDMETIAQPIDFLGLNIYFAEQVADTPEGPREIPFAPGWARTSMDWPVVPESLYWGPKFFYDRYRQPLVITENGMANNDWVGQDGFVHDPQRIDFTQRYLDQLARGIEDGVDARGYFHWSLLDNFEWAEGYRQRFGLVHVDFATGHRTLKDSARWYRDWIGARASSPGKGS